MDILQKKRIYRWFLSSEYHFLYRRTLVVSLVVTFIKLHLFILANDGVMHRSGSLNEGLRWADPTVVSCRVFFVLLILVCLVWHIVFVLFHGRKVVFVGAIVRSVCLVLEFFVLNNERFLVASPNRGKRRVVPLGLGNQVERNGNE